MQSVLVVDDDATVRSLIEVILLMEGFTVHTAASSEEALAITRSTPIDLVTIDLMMPGTTGWELSATLRSEPTSAHCRQMIVSAAAMVEDVAGAPLFADAVLAKPFDFANFTAVLRELMSRPIEPDAQNPHEAALDQLLRDRTVAPVFQPIVDLQTRQVIGVEGLARGPEGPLHEPGPMFDVAHRMGRLHELDSLCRLSAITAARDAGAHTPPLVFVNVEPGTAELPMTEELRDLLNSQLPFQVVVEFTERALTQRLPALLRHAAEIRGRGNLVALDDLGVDPRAVALLPLLQPEILKLDMSLLANDLSASAAATAVAVAAFAERTGATVIAEGIETEEHVTAALALGAHWGQASCSAAPDRWPPLQA